MVNKGKGYSYSWGPPGKAGGPGIGKEVSPPSGPLLSEPGKGGPPKQCQRISEEAQETSFQAGHQHLHGPTPSVFDTAAWQPQPKDDDSKCMQCGMHGPTNKSSVFDTAAWQSQPTADEFKCLQCGKPLDKNNTAQNTCHECERVIEAKMSVREQCGNQQLLSRTSQKPTGHPDYRSMAYTNTIQTGKGHSKSKY